MPETLLNKIFSAKVSEVKSLNPEIREIKFKLDHSFSFIPGQYVWVELPSLKVQDPRGNRRAFSVSSLPNTENTISIIGRISASGYKQALFELAEGNPVTIHGPFGPLKFPEQTDIPVVCMAGGVGIAPFLSLIPDSLQKSPQRKISLVYASRESEEGPFLPYFQSLQDKNTNFSVVNIKGKITRGKLEELNTSLPNAYWIIIGSKSMNYSVASDLYAIGLPEDRLIFEEFFISKSVISFPISNNIIEVSKLFTEIMAQTSNHVVLTDADGYITFANKAAEIITGYSAAELIGQTPRVWGGLESPEFYRNLWHTIKTEKKPFLSEMTNRRKSGEYYSVISHISPFTDKNGNLIGFMGTEEDITKLKQTKAELERLAKLTQDQQKATLNILEDIGVEKSKSDALLSSIGEGLIAVDLERKVTFLNKIASDMLGLSEKELIGKVITDMRLEDDAGNLVPLEARPTYLALKNDKISRVVYFFVKKDKTRFPLMITATPIKQNGKTVGLIEILRDLTREKEIDTMKTEFVSLASHQLRTPLTAIKWGLESFIGKGSSTFSVEQKEKLNDINSSTLRMIDLVNSLLNVSRIESGKIVVNSEPNNIVKVANDVVSKLKMEMAKKNISLIMDVADNVPQVNLDVNLISNVYQNLLNNSLHYSPVGSKLVLSISLKERQIISSIQDEGMGIPDNEKPHIFEKFYRASNAKQVRPDGTGLGLYIVKSIVESSGGRLWFDSTVGKGSTFYFSIPLTGMKAKEGGAVLN